MTQVFLLSHYSAAGDYSEVSVADEAVFSSFERAEAHIRAGIAELLEPEADGSSFTTAEEMAASQERYSITAYTVDDPEPWETLRAWHYDGAGTLVQTYDATDPEEREQPNDIACEGKYALGDIVFVRACLWNTFSGIDRDIIGVIAWRPMPLEEWVAKGREESDWNGYYRVDFINHGGFLDHEHIYEAGLEPFPGDIPKELNFLRTLSDHYKGKRKIKDSVLGDLYNCKIFVEKVRFFTEDDLEPEG